MPTNKEMEEFIEILLERIERTLGLENINYLDKHEFSRAYVLGKNKKELKIKDSEI